MPFSTRVKSSLVLKLFSPWRWLIRSTDDIIFSKLNGLNSLNDAGFFLNWVFFFGFWGNHSDLLIHSAVQIEAGQILAEEVAAQTCPCLLLLIIYGVRLLLRLSFAFKSDRIPCAQTCWLLINISVFCFDFWKNFEERMKRQKGSCDSKATELAPGSSLRKAAELLQPATTIHIPATDSMW